MFFIILITLSLHLTLFSICLTNKFLSSSVLNISLAVTFEISLFLTWLKLNFNQGKNKLISNVTANEILDTNDLKNLLIKQIENRVRWREGVINMINNDVDHFIEIGPGKVLSGLVKRINREVKIDTLNSQGDIEGLKI